ncbi:acetoacetyl-CoA synthetase [Hydrogenophaga sp. T4]|nr:acetoacetyl-CoA synthetase [Hydrogenophaga sp. T4]
MAFLATVSVGAIWSVCSPDMGAPTVLDRFRQIDPKVLIAVDGYRWGGKRFDRRDTVAMLLDGLPSVERCVLLPYLERSASVGALRGGVLWSEVVSGPAELRIESMPFDTRCGWCIHRAPPACPNPSCTAMAASCWSRSS